MNIPFKKKTPTSQMVTQLAVIMSHGVVVTGSNLPPPTCVNMLKNKQNKY
jgi:hypothetical protein